MAALINLSIKGKDGNYHDYTISINDETNQWGQNVTMYHKQSPDDQKAKVKKNFVGNGRVFWTDGKIVKGLTKDELKLKEEVDARQQAKDAYVPKQVDKPWDEQAEAEDDLPF